MQNNPFSKLFQHFYTREEGINFVLRVLYGINSLAALVIVILIVGFYLDKDTSSIVYFAMNITILLFAFLELLRWCTDLHKKKEKRAKRWKERVLAVLLVASLLFKEDFFGSFRSYSSEINVVNLTLVYFGVTQIIIVASYIIGLVRDSSLRNIKVRPSALTALSFAMAIIIGSLLLYMPKSSSHLHRVNYTDALFISTSAVCVTGLSSIDIAEEFTLTGQVVILFLMQVGGIGVMTISAFLTAFLLGGMSFRMHVMLKDVLSEDNLGEIKKLLLRISLFAFLVEFIGMVMMYFSLNQYNTDGIFSLDIGNLGYAIFHSVSSFCNAGFSVYPDALFNPAVHRNYWFLGSNMFLIFVGGLGYLAIADLFRFIIYKRKFVSDYALHPYRRLSSTTKLIFIVSLCMLTIGTTILVLSGNFSHLGWMTLFDKIFYSLHSIISAKTAGFDAVGLKHFSNLALLVIIIEMWIGGSPGSTAGGIRNTTFGLLVLNFVNYLRGRENLHFFRRRIDPASIEKAQMVFFATAIATAISIFLLVVLEPEKQFMDLLFEAASAISTTGLSLGITPYLSNASKYVLIFTMYMGRLGILTFAMSFFKERPSLSYEYPDEKVIVG